MEPPQKIFLQRLSKLAGLLLILAGVWSHLTSYGTRTTILSLSAGIILLCLPLILWTYREGEGVQADF